MADLYDRVMMWVAAGLYGIWVLVHILKDVFAVGFREVFQRKPITKPACLTDPTLGTHGFLSLEDVKIHYVASGPEDKPLMLFVHGFPEFWFSWRHQIREFQKDYRVVAYDQRGCGESGKPKKLEDYKLKKLTSDLKQVISALGYKSCVLVGHDWGAVVVWSFSRLFPEMVDKLITMNGPPLPLFEKVLKRKDQQKLSWYVFFFQLPYLPELYLRVKNFEALESCYGITKTKGICFSDAFQNPMTTDELNAYKYTFSQPDTLTTAVNYYRAIFRDYAAEKQDLNYTMPILLVWGCDDKAITLVTADLVEKSIPNITVKRILKAGHFVQMDTPELTNKAMREWLNGQEKSQ
ncbi:unnamed protein product [Lymnaea stagnalis]|uniref:AB hydrolase-1 domain-containing protein n=1 Tax=Lymnaea stagnalis TaxID=6523 RepID=A0AAV2HT91_LYMST